MRSALALTVLLVACGGTPSGDDDAGNGPRDGFWVVDSGPLSEWVCNLVTAQQDCVPPAYFSPLPDEVQITGGDSVVWSATVTHRGAVDDDGCIEVPAAQEHGIPRSAYRLCRETINGTLSDDLITPSPSLAWNGGTPDECWCSATFRFVGE